MRGPAMRPAPGTREIKSSLVLRLHWRSPSWLSECCLGGQTNADGNSRPKGRSAPVHSQKSGKADGLCLVLSWFSATVAHFTGAGASTTVCAQDQDNCCLTLDILYEAPPLSRCSCAVCVARWQDFPVAMPYRSARISIRLDNRGTAQYRLAGAATAGLPLACPGATAKGSQLGVVQTF